MKLKDFFEKSYVTELSVANIDDVLRTINREKVDEVEVDRNEMALIADFFIAKIINPDLKDKVFIERKVDKIMGVKLVLKE